MGSRPSKYNACMARSVIVGIPRPRNFRDSSLISTSVRMVHPQRTSDEKRPGRGRQRINPREFATTGPRTPETAANYLLHRGLRQDGGGDQRGVSEKKPPCSADLASARTLLDHCHVLET